jgi:nitrogen fixation/metabolism regulation signal transduction histidine kinase
VAFLIARRITKPILVPRDTAEHIISGDLIARAGITSGDEVQDLAASFNQMTDTILQSRADLVAARDCIENVVQSLAECLVVFRIDREIELVNVVTTRLLGHSKVEMIGRRVIPSFSIARKYFSRIKSRLTFENHS